MFLAPREFSGHTSGVRHVYYFCNDTRLVSCSEDKTVRVWDLNSGQVSKPFIFFFNAENEMGIILITL